MIFYLHYKSHFYDNEDVQERKIRKIKNSFIKKAKTLSLIRSSKLLLRHFLALPYISYESNPVFFGKYSLKLTLFLALYVGTMILCLVSFKSYKRKEIKMKKIKNPDSPDVIGLNRFLTLKQSEESFKING